MHLEELREVLDDINQDDLDELCNQFNGLSIVSVQQVLNCLKILYQRKFQMSCSLISKLKNEKGNRF
jgi:hypothetical protein